MSTPGKHALTVKSLLCSHTRLSKCQLEWRSTPIEPEEIFDDTHLMPAVTRWSSIKAMELLGWDLDVKNEPAKEGLIGLRSFIPQFKGGNDIGDVVRAAFYFHAAERIFGLSRGGIIECYPVYEFHKLDLSQQAIFASKSRMPLAQHVERLSTP